MATKLFKALANSIAAQGEQESVENQRVITASELTLVVTVDDRGVHPQAIIFPLLGVDFVMLPNGVVSFTSSENEGEYMDLTDEETLEEITAYLEWRAGALEKLKL